MLPPIEKEEAQKQMPNPSKIRRGGNMLRSERTASTLAIRRSFEKEDYLVKMNKQEKKHFESYNFVYFLNTLKQEQTLPQYHNKFKTVSDKAYYNVARRRNDILNGL